MTATVRSWQPVLLLALAGLASAASAETMSVTENASYAMSDEETRNAGRQHCVESAKHSALDRAGSVFEAELTSDASEAGKDDARLKMRSYFAGVVSSQMVNDHVDVDQTGRTIETCTVQIGYDPQTVSAKMHDIADAEGLRKQVAQQQTTIAALQDQVKQADTVAAPPQAIVQAAQTGASAPAGFTAPPQMAAAYAAPVAAAPKVYYPPAAAYASLSMMTPQVAPQYAPPAYVQPAYSAPISVPAPVYGVPSGAYVVSAPRAAALPPPVYYASAPAPRPVVTMVSVRPAIAMRPMVRPPHLVKVRRAWLWRR